MSRITNSFKNITNSLVGYLFKILVQFACRSLFIRILGAEYLGLGGLFSNILTMLSLLELGVGTAVTFSLYRPLAEGDQEQVKALMALLRRAYILIGLAVGGIGLALTPLLPYLVRQMPEIPHIGWIYALFVANAAVSYFCGYKRTLILADQKQYLVSRYAYGCGVLLNLAQAALLVATRSYFLYLAATLACTLLENLLIARRADRLYPALLTSPVPPLPAETIGEVGRNLRALFFHQMGTVLVTGTDSLLMARMVDLASVGIYSNYLLVINALNTALNLIFSGVAASIGNLSATEADQTKRAVFDRLNFLSRWLVGAASICLVCLFDPFIALWAGEAYRFPMTVVLVICANFFIEGMRRPVLVTKNAMGLYWDDRYRPLVEGVINLGLSLLLAPRLGVAGILLGTFISGMATNFWIEPLVLYRHGFHLPLGRYLLGYLGFTGLTAALGFACWLLCGLVVAGGAAGLALRLAICAVVPNLGYFACLGRRPEFQYLWALAKQLLRRPPV